MLVQVFKVKNMWVGGIFKLFKIICWDMPDKIRCFIYSVNDNDKQKKSVNARFGFQLTESI